MAGKVVCITQARMGSTRLPGKVLRPVKNRPLLQYHLSRLAGAESLDQIVVATTTAAEDDVIERFCRERGVAVFRGSGNDVLDRYYQCATAYDAGIVVRVTADCPLIDPALIDLVVDSYRAQQPAADYVRLNTGYYPLGVDAEVFAFSALEKAWREADQPDFREHVTPYLYKRPDLFLCHAFHESGVEYGGYRLCVDEQPDFDLVKRILEDLYDQNPLFSYLEVVNYLQDRPDLRQINQGVKQRTV